MPASEWEPASEWGSARGSASAQESVQESVPGSASAWGSAPESASARESVPGWAREPAWAPASRVPLPVPIGAIEPAELTPPPASPHALSAVRARMLTELERMRFMMSFPFRVPLRIKRFRMVNTLDWSPPPARVRGRHVAGPLGGIVSPPYKTFTNPTDVDGSPMPVSTTMTDYIGQTARAVQRWKTTLSVPADADDARAATLIRGAMMRAAREAAAFDDPGIYNDDHGWSHNGMRGITRARIREEVEVSRDRMAPAPEEWGIMARVSCGDVFFDVPIAMDLDESAARNVLERMEGMEARFVDVDAVAQALPNDDIQVFFHADNWGRLREIALNGFLTMEEALDFRRPVVWDLMRARLAELPVPELPPFALEEFHTRHARSARYDASLMRSTRGMVGARLQGRRRAAHPGLGRVGCRR